MADEDFGKRLFFINPPAILSEFANELWNLEIEAYSIPESANLPAYLRDNPNALVFHAFEPEKSSLALLKQKLASYRSDEKLKAIGIGLFSVRDLTRQFNEIKESLDVDCGYFTITDKNRVLQNLLQICAHKQVRGRRKYIRVSCPRDYSQFNCELGGKTIRGFLLDFSKAGMAVVFENMAPPALNTKLTNIQLKLYGTIVTLDGVIFKTDTTKLESTGQSIAVILFVPASIDKIKEEKMHAFIQRKLQKDLEALIF